MKKIDRLDVLVELFHKSGGILRMSEVLALGMHRRDLYQLRDEGRVEALHRGLYRVVSTRDLSLPDFVAVGKKIPHGVICLVSALSFHELTTQIPHFVYVAVPNNARKPSAGYPPVRVFWYGEDALTTGVERHDLGGCTVKIFDREKTLVDAVKYRNKIGVDVALEALRMYWKSGKTDLNSLYCYARRMRVLKVIKPLMEAVVSG